MLNHTPGPWAEIVDSSYEWWIQNTQGAIICVSTRISDDDTRLICAAPEMLAALRNDADVFRRICRLVKDIRSGDGLDGALDAIEMLAATPAAVEIIARLDAKDL